LAVPSALAARHVRLQQLLPRHIDRRWRSNANHYLSGRSAVIQLKPDALLGELTIQLGGIRFGFWRQEYPLAWLAIDDEISHISSLIGSPHHTAGGEGVL